jgi:hypothetical protein
MTTRDQLAQWAAVLYDAADLIELRPLPPDKGRRRWIRAGELPGLAADLTRENDRGANLFAGVCPRNADGAGGADAVDFGRAAWADFDGLDIRAALDATRAAGLPDPSAGVNSGHGVHLFWRFAAPVPAADLETFCRDLAHAVGADPNATDRARILRLPGFTNWKEPVADAVLIAAYPDRVYAFADLRAIVPTAPRVDPPARPAAPADRTADRDALLKRASAYVAKMDAAGEGNRNAAAFKVAAVLCNDFDLADEEAAPILAAWNARCTPPLADGELSAVLASARKTAKASPRRLADAPPRRPAADHDRPADEAPIPDAPADGDPLDAVLQEIADEAAGRRRTIPMPWPRLGSLSKLLRPGTVAVIAGPPGNAKSFFALWIGFAADASAVRWSYLPLEESRTFHIRRLAAMLAKEWGPVDDPEDDPAVADRAREAVQAHRAALARLADGVHENPCLPRPDIDGRARAGDVGWRSVLGWIEHRAERDRVVIVDPFSQIGFDGREAWRAQGDFMREAVGLAAASGATILIVAHTIKKPERDRALTLGDIQGASELTRLSAAVLLLDAHDEKASPVYRTGGLIGEARHNRTVTIAKARHGKGTGHRIAYAFGRTGPVFDERGVIAPKDAALSAPPEPDAPLAYKD